MFSVGFPITRQGFDNQVIWQNHTLKFYHHVPLRGGHTPPFRLQVREIVPCTKPKQFYKSAPFLDTVSAYLCKYGGFAKNQFHDSSL